MTVCVLHTGEGSTLAGIIATLEANNSRSHDVYDPAKDQGQTLINWPDNARSLRNLSGGVETNNRGGVFQVELVGFAASVPGYSDEWYRNLAKYLIDRSDKIGFPLDFPHEFKGSAGAYGVRSSTRLTNAEWLAVEGIIGHQHVPENTHWDPGALDITRLQQFITDITGDTTTMAAPIYTLAQYKKMAEPMLASQITLQATGHYAGKLDAWWGNGSDGAVKAVADENKALKAEVRRLGLANELLITERDTAKQGRVNAIAIGNEVVAERDAALADLADTKTELAATEESLRDAREDRENAELARDSSARELEILTGANQDLTTELYKAKADLESAATQRELNAGAAQILTAWQAANTAAITWRKQQ